MSRLDPAHAAPQECIHVSMCDPGFAKMMKMACVVVVLAHLSAGWEVQGQVTGGAASGVAPSTAPPHAVAVSQAKKGAYTGPTEIVVLPATSMLDEPGRQRLDPDGKPMLNPPVKQQQGKKGQPLFDAEGNPVMQTAEELGYDEKGKKIKVKKEKPPKVTSVTIRRGTFTVDGAIGKAALNYDVPDLKYLYLYVPGMGVAVVSNAPFDGAKEEKNAFNGRSLMVTVGEHVLEIASDEPLLGKKKKPCSAFVLLDREATLPSKYPVVGYGQVAARPYNWPGSKVSAALKGPVEPPPLPENLRPALLLEPCPAGQTLRQDKAALPGGLAPKPQCVPIHPTGAQAAGATSATDRTEAPAASPPPGTAPPPAIPK